MALLNSDDSESIFLAESNKFHFADFRITYKKKILGLEVLNTFKSFQVNLAKKKNIQDLQNMVDSLFKSRYYFDQKFQAEKINEFYKGWIEKLYLGYWTTNVFVYSKKKCRLICTIKYISSNSATIVYLEFQKISKIGLSNYLLKNVNNILR